MTTLTPTLAAVIEARDNIRDARRTYHEALADANWAGHTPEGIALVLNTRPLYIANTLRKHREGTCGCSTS